MWYKFFAWGSIISIVLLYFLKATFSSPEYNWPTSLRILIILAFYVFSIGLSILSIKDKKEENNRPLGVLFLGLIIIFSGGLLFGAPSIVGLVSLPMLIVGIWLGVSTIKTINAGETENVKKKEGKE